MNKSVFIDELIKKADIVGIIGKYVPLQKKGANFFGVCPFHPDTNPSMSVSSKKGIFKCFSCGASGNVITFVQKYKKISFIEAIKETALMSNYSLEQIEKIFAQGNDKFSTKEWRLFNLNNEANEIFKNLLFIESNKNHLNYLLNRKISLETIKQFELGFSTKDNSKDMIYQILTNKNEILGADRDKNLVFNEDELLKASLINMSKDSQRIWDYFFNRITFPIFDHQGFLVGFIGRTIEKNEDTKYLLSNSSFLFNKSRVLYNLNAVYNEKPETLIVLEGNLDVLSVYEAKNKNVADEINDYQAVGLMGVALTNDHINILHQQKQLKNILLWLDNDQAGKTATITTGMKLLQNTFNVFVIENDTSEKDVNDLLIKFGKEKINQMIANNKIDFISYLIKTKFIDVKEIQKLQVTEELLNVIVKYGNALFKSQHLQLLADVTGFKIEDITDKFMQIKTSTKSVFEKNYYNYQNNFSKQNVEQAQIKNTFDDKLIKSMRKILMDITAIILINPGSAQKIISKLMLILKLDSKIDEYLSIIKIIAGYMKNNDVENEKPTVKILLEELEKNNLSYDFSSFEQKFKFRSKEFLDDRLDKQIGKVICDFCKIEINNRNKKLGSLDHNSEEYKNEQKIIDNLRKLYNDHDKK